jgi:hypothetical protein
MWVTHEHKSCSPPISADLDPGSLLIVRSVHKHHGQKSSETYDSTASPMSLLETPVYRPVRLEALYPYNTISLELECINSFHQIGIPGQ